METSKRRPTIGIDIDGVLRDNLGIMVDLYNDFYKKTFYKDLNMTIDDVKEFKVEVSFPLIQKVLNVKPSDFFFNTHAREIFLDAPAYHGVKECIDRLKKVADIFIITYQKDYINKNESNQLILIFILNFINSHIYVI